MILVSLGALIKRDGVCSVCAAAPNGRREVFLPCAVEAAALMYLIPHVIYSTPV